MSKRTISVPDAMWDEMISRAGRIGLDRDGRALSVSAYIRELHEQSTRADAQPEEREFNALTDTEWCPRSLCRNQGRPEHGGYCSASHRLADEQEGKR